MKIFKNETAIIETTISDSNGDAVNLQGCSVGYYFETYNNEVIYSGITTTFNNPSAGIVNITIPSTTTKDINEGNYIFQVYVENADNQRFYSKKNYLSVEKNAWN